MEATEIRLQQLKQDYEPYKAQDDLNMLIEVFPQIGESLRMTRFCRSIGLAVDTIKKLFTGEAVPYSGKLHSQKHDRNFNVQDGKIQLYKEKDNPGKLHLSINGQNIMEWFKEQYVKIKQTVRPHIKPASKLGSNNNKGFKR